MIIPIVIISAILLFFYFGTKSSNKAIENQYKFIAESLKDEIELYIEQTKSSTMTIGLGNQNFLFNRCDLYLTQNALIIFGFTKNSFFKQLSFPIIITKDLEEFSNRFPFAYVRKANEVSFKNSIVAISFGEKGITKTEVALKLKSLDSSEINKLKELVNQNSW